MTPRPVLHLMRVTLEAVSPLSIGSGDTVEKTVKAQANSQRDDANYKLATVVRDANGLPTLPGPSVQGALRHVYAAETSLGAADLYFGFADGDDGAAGRLIVGWGAVHDASGVAVVGRRLRSPDADLLLDRLAADGADDDHDATRGGFERDHVALNARSVVDGRQKFARAAVPRGCRFSIEFALWGGASANDIADDHAQLLQIARLFDHPALRLGGSGGRGYGRVRLLKATHVIPDLSDATALRALRRQPPSEPFPDTVSGADLMAEPAFGADFLAAPVVARLSLTPINPWRVGGRHAASMTEGTYGVRRPDGGFGAPPIDGMEPRGVLDVQTIVREPRIVWNEATGQGEWIAPGPDGPWDFPVPGSAVKGPLVHRALFHFNRRNGRTLNAEDWIKAKRAGDEAAQKKALEALTAFARRPEALERLLGSAKESLDAGRDGAGRAARLWVDDGAAAGVVAVQAVDHNMIDRFTGGVKGSALYAEEVLVGGTLNIALTILPPLPGADDAWTDAVVGPVLDALEDLCAGRLAIGAKSLGAFRGSVAWEGPDAARAPWETAWRARTS